MTTFTDKGRYDVSFKVAKDKDKNYTLETTFRSPKDEKKVDNLVISKDGVITRGDKKDMNRFELLAAKTLAKYIVNPSGITI